jgi:hypothetical protein
MSERFQTKIEIGGQLDRAHLDELDDLASEWEIDWSYRATRENIEQASATGTALVLTDNELSYGVTKRWPCSVRRMSFCTR